MSSAYSRPRLLLAPAILMLSTSLLCCPVFAQSRGDGALPPVTVQAPDQAPCPAAVTALVSAPAPDPTTMRSTSWAGGPPAAPPAAGAALLAGPGAPIRRRGRCWAGPASPPRARGQRRELRRQETITVVAADTGRDIFHGPLARQA